MKLLQNSSSRKVFIHQPLIGVFPDCRSRVFVQKFVNASLHGLRDTLAEPGTAFESSMKRMPELSPDNQPLQRDVLSATLEYYKPVQGRSTGSTNPQAWQATQDFLRSIGVINQSIDPQQYFSNAFVDKATP